MDKKKKKKSLGLIWSIVNLTALLPNCSKKIDRAPNFLVKNYFYRLEELLWFPGVETISMVGKGKLNK